jgi:hypothetical protein
MKLRIIGLAAAVAFVPAAAFAQGSSMASRNESDASAGVAFNTLAPQLNNSHAASGAPARDGCINVPGEAHNSADCSRIDASDMNTAQNIHSTDLSGRPTGTSENAQRNARILSGQSLN